jgi:hypothetical protein
VSIGLFLLILPQYRHQAIAGFPSLSTHLIFSDFQNKAVANLAMMSKEK